MPPRSDVFAMRVRAHLRQLNFVILVSEEGKKKRLRLLCATITTIHFNRVQASSSVGKVLQKAH